MISERSWACPGRVMYLFLPGYSVPQVLLTITICFVHWHSNASFVNEHAKFWYYILHVLLGITEMPTVWNGKSLNNAQNSMTILFYSIP